MSQTQTQQAPPQTQAQTVDYSLTGINGELAIEKGLADADWYTTPVPRDQMRLLLERRNGPAIRDTVIWFSLLIGFGYAGFVLWGTWWALIPFALYGVVYASSSDSRWHEASHGTAFKTDWMNNALYEVASFMVSRESTPWRWSHARHHSDTIIIGRDPEIAVPRPPNIRRMVMSFFGLKAFPSYARTVCLHSIGKMTPAEKTYIPESQYTKVFFIARIHLLVHLSTIALAIYLGSFLPMMYIGLPVLYGSWLMPFYGFTQHVGLAEDVLDHRLNSRTVYMNLANRYLYWNMNYHVEHHMFPLVPYHALPKLHDRVKSDLPKPYNGIIETFREIVPTVLRQVKDPGYFVKRKLPESAGILDTSGDSGAGAGGGHSQTIVAQTLADAEGWLEVCKVNALHKGDVLRLDYQNKTFAVYRTQDDQFHATDGMCTHGNTHLGTGLLKGNVIECPKHNGRFDITDGSPKRMPVCVALKTYPVRMTDDKLFLNVTTAGGCGAIAHKTYRFKVVSNDNVATFIKELVLEPMESGFEFTPGDYIQLDIPAYDQITFDQMQISVPFLEVWQAQHVFDFTATNAAPTRRNYSLASNAKNEKYLRFNVRIATPPRGQDCDAGAGSSYVFSLKPGDSVTAIGPFGDFHIKNTDKEMIYLGGGAGMAPLRAHLSHLFETQQTPRRVSYWYGARSMQEVFYEQYFRDLEKQFSNFSFHLALSEPQPSDHWTGHTGFIHDVLLHEYLAQHETPRDPRNIEFYLCGPPAMVQAATAMLQTLGVSDEQIAFDEF